MTRKAKRKIARENGAKAAGTKSQQGIEASSKNALKHGLSSTTVVLAVESQPKFDILFQAYIEKFQPQDAVEMGFVNQMVAARWRQQRIWEIQTAAIDLEMEIQENKYNADTSLNKRSRVA